MANTRWCLLLSYLLIFVCLPVLCEDGETHEEGNADGETENGSNSEANEEFVLVLTTENFNDTVNVNPTILVEFYAPWCDSCKNLAPQYAAVAEVLAKNDPPVALAKVDATAHIELAKRFEVAGFPTLKFFKNGKEYEYIGPGNKEGMIEYMQIIADPEWEPEPEAVVTLTKDNFDDVVKNENLMLVQFCQPGSGHCKKFIPIYERAAKELKKGDPPIILAKVDAAADFDLATKYGVTSFPTLKVFRNGRAIEFKGEFGSAYDIMYYMKRQVGEGAKEVKSAKALKELFVPHEIAVVGFFDSRDEPKAASYTDLATEIRDDFNFGIVFDEELRKTYNINPNSVAVFTGDRFHTKYEPKWFTLEVRDDTTSDNIFEFVRDHHLPLVGQYVRPVTNHYDKKRPLCLVFYSVDFGFDHKDATQLWRLKIADVAIKFPDVTFAIADDEEHTNILQQFGLDESGEELNVGLFGTDGRKYAMEPMEEFDGDHIGDFLNKYKQGKLTPYIKSQRPPKKQVGSITVVVGETFEQVVKDSSKDVLIELYSPWCELCKQLELKLERLSKKLKDSHLVIAKMDATANDLPVNYTAAAYPTIYFAVASNKESPLKYEGPREVDDLEKYLREHAVVAFGKNKKEEL